jgi:hypothetical protein
VQGRLFLSNCRACFYYDFLGFGERRVVVRYDGVIMWCFSSHRAAVLTPVFLYPPDIRSVLKKNTAIVFPNAIEILKTTGEVLFFASFLLRDQGSKEVFRSCSLSVCSPAFFLYLLVFHKAYASILHLIQNHDKITHMYAPTAGTAFAESDSESDSASSDDALSSGDLRAESDVANDTNDSALPSVSATTDQAYQSRGSSQLSTLHDSGLFWRRVFCVFCAFCWGFCSHIVCPFPDIQVRSVTQRAAQ